MNHKAKTVVGWILHEARELLSDPDRWTGIFSHDATTRDDEGCHFSHPMAYRFSALAAVYYVGTVDVFAPEPRSENWEHPATTAAAGYLLHEAYVLNHRGWTGLNDMGHAEVLAAYDRAIERERSGLPPVPLDGDVMPPEKWLKVAR